MNIDLVSINRDLYEINKKQDILSSKILGLKKEKEKQIRNYIYKDIYNENLERMIKISRKMKKFNEYIDEIRKVRGKFLNLYNKSYYRIVPKRVTIDDKQESIFGKDVYRSTNKLCLNINGIGTLESYYYSRPMTYYLTDLDKILAVIQKEKSFLKYIKNENKKEIHRIFKEGTKKLYRDSRDFYPLKDYTIEGKFKSFVNEESDIALFGVKKLKLVDSNYMVISFSDRGITLSLQDTRYSYSHNYRRKLESSTLNIFDELVLSQIPLEVVKKMEYTLNKLSRQSKTMGKDYYNLEKKLIPYVIFSSI